MEKLNIVERVALHLVDRKLPGPRFSNNEVDLNSFNSAADQVALNDFFEGHINKVWDAQEGRRTIAASFFDNSPLPSFREEIATDPTVFFERSRNLAQRLYDVSKGLSTSSGLLMVVWFSRVDDQRKFLGLFKMDPGPSHKITVRTGGAEEALLQLAVRHVEQALPDPRDQVLKWAVLPHPVRPTYGVKAQDQQGSSDPAQYFMEFLGCQPVPSEREQIRSLLRAIPEYAGQYHPDKDWKSDVQEIEKRLEEEPVITNDTVVETIKEMPAFEGFNEDGFQNVLDEHEVGEVDFTSRTLKKTKVEYRLPSKIVIRGPRLAVENLVQVRETDDGVEFRILAPNYRKFYV